MKRNIALANFAAAVAYTATAVISISTRVMLGPLGLLLLAQWAGFSVLGMAALGLAVAVIQTIISISMLVVSVIGLRQATPPDRGIIIECLVLYAGGLLLSVINILFAFLFVMAGCGALVT